MDAATLAALGVLITGLVQLLKDFYDLPVAKKKRLAFLATCAALIGAAGIGYLTGQYVPENLIFGAVFGAATAGDVGLGLQVAKVFKKK